jgi:hypothetical protein
VPLRPVSELGLVDITDVPERDRNRAASRRHSTRARTSLRASTKRKPAASRNASKTLAGAPQTSAPAKSRSTGAAKRREPSRSVQSVRTEQIKIADDGQPRLNTKPRRKSASPATSSQRSRSRSKAATSNRSGGATPSATPRTPKRANRSTSGQRGVTTARRRTSGGLRIKGDHASREAQRAGDGRGPDGTKLPFAAKIGISVLMGASAVAGNLLARAALER